MSPQSFDMNVLLQQVTLLVLGYLSSTQTRVGVEVLQVFCLSKQVVLCLKGVCLQGTVGTQQAAGPEGGLNQTKDEDESADAHLSVKENDAEAALAPKGLALTLLESALWTALALGVLLFST